MAKDKEQEREPEPSDLIGGVLNLFGLKIDLGELLATPEKASSDLVGGLEGLRETLKRLGGREVLSDEEWRRGGTGVTGSIQTHGPLGEREFHVGTLGKPQREAPRRPAPQPPEEVEPPVDVFDEAQEVVIVADVPGVSLEDLEIKVEGGVFSLSTRATAWRRFRKEIPLETQVEQEGLQATCRNGVLEVRIQKRGANG